MSVCVPELPGDSLLVEVQAAASGQEALRLLRVARCDLLLTGDELPDMSGCTLASRVRARCPGQRWALVRRSRTADDRIEIEARSLGAVAVFDDVPDSARLHEMARSLLRGGRDPPADPSSSREQAAI